MKQLKNILSNLPTTLCESNFNNFEYLMILKINVLKKNPKEGYNVISACTDTWKETMTVWHNKQEDRIQGLEHQLHMMNNA